MITYYYIISLLHFTSKKIKCFRTKKTLFRYDVSNNLLDNALGWLVVGEIYRGEPDTLTSAITCRKQRHIIQYCSICLCRKSHLMHHIEINLADWFRFTKALVQSIVTFVFCLFFFGHGLLRLLNYNFFFPL